ncbi:adenosine deaminase [Clostridium neuense]|uniref:Adenosine deaminase n=1 Tax=Clostridium neuense TaxID=1728934 RepID=A0ABW8TK91_9CLOT
MDLREKIKNIPKTELHCHIDGSLRPSTIIELLRKNNLPLPVSNSSNIEDNFKISGNCGSLKEYLNKFDFPIKVMQKKEDLYRVTFELLEDAKKDGIRYIELRFAPYFHTAEGLKVEEVVEAVLSAMKDAESKLNIYSGLILCAMRHEPVSKSIAVINLARKYTDSGVVAVDLAGNESDFPPELHKAAFDLAYEADINITIHAGETGICKNIMKSINILHASRIGHGIFAYKDKSTLHYLIKNHVPLEMCPKSNLDTKAVGSYKEHPIKTYFEDGLRVTLNTDNRTVSNLNLVDEYMNLVNILGFTEAQILQVMRNGFLSAFCSEDLKNKLLNEFEKSII